MTYGSVQYGRAVAALAVVLYHGITVMNTDSHFLLFEYGKHGVDLFFVISGFVMVITTSSGCTAREFFLKRLARIVPLYWLATFIIVLAALALPAAFRSTEVDAPRLLMSLAFIPHHHVTQQIWPILVQGWTLNYEMYFYALFSVALFAAPGRNVPLLCGFLIGAVCMGALFSFESPALRVYTSPLLLEFLLGVVLATAVRSPNTSHLVIFNVASTITAIASVSLLGVAVDRPEFVGPAAAALLGWSIWLEARGMRFSNKTVLLLADASYSIYLFHTFALGAVRFAGNKAGLHWSAWSVDVLTIIVGTGLSVAVGVASYLVFEKRVQSFVRHRIFHKPRAPAAVVEGAVR